MAMAVISTICAVYLLLLPITCLTCVCPCPEAADQCNHTLEVADQSNPTLEVADQSNHTLEVADQSDHTLDEYIVLATNAVRTLLKNMRRTQSAAWAKKWEQPFVTMGAVFTQKDEVQFMQSYMKRLFGGRAVHVCEIGFNAGHSALVFLTANPRCTYTAFDLAELPWSETSAQLLRTWFPTRFNFRVGTAGLGPALLQYAEAIRNGAPKCDLLSVDGDHRLKPSLNDYTRGTSRAHPRPRPRLQHGRDAKGIGVLGVTGVPAGRGVCEVPALG